METVANSSTWKPTVKRGAKRGAKRGEKLVQSLVEANGLEAGDGNYRDFARLELHYIIT